LLHFLFSATALLKTQSRNQEQVSKHAIAKEISDAWYCQYEIETFKGFWDRAEMMEIVIDAIGPKW